MEANNDYFNQNNEPPRQKPHLVVRIFLCVYAFLWFNMLVTTGLNSLYIGHLDYETGSIALALTIAYPFIIKYF